MIHRVLFFMHLIQDLDLVFPLLEKAKQRGNIETFVYVTDRLIKASPRVQKALESLPVGYKVISYARTLMGLGPSLDRFNALVTVSESNARPHWVAYQLAGRANRLGLKTYTLQHGLEQPGLTYFDEIYKPDRFRFRSQKIMLWGRLGSLHKNVPDSIRRRCVSVGWPKQTGALASLQKEAWGKTIILVSENLHRACYRDDFRKQFVDCILTVADQFQGITFIVKPHHNQRWITLHGADKFSGLKNVVLADSKDSRWEPYTASAIIGIADAVITTPSTVVLDAAVASCPVAVVNDGRQDLSRYEPLSRLKGAGEWTGFLGDVLNPGRRREQSDKAREFADRAVIQGDVCGRVMDLIAGF